MNTKDCTNMHLLWHCWDRRDDFPKDDQPQVVNTFLDAVVSRSSARPDVYEEFYKELCSQTSLTKLDFVATSKLAIGRGNEAPGEWGVSLNQIYGTPMIPGSSIKGAMLREALIQLEIEAPDTPFEWLNLNYPAKTEGLEILRRWFGDIGSDGRLIIHDALWKPDDKPFFKRDVVTRHNKSYYEGTGQPHDMDAPIPVSGVSVAIGTVFTFFLELDNPGDEDIASKLLTSTLQNLGIGGKTSSGYGRMKPA